MQRLEFEEDNSVMELRLLVLSAMSYIIRKHLVSEEASLRTIYKDAFRIMKYNYGIVEAAQGGDAALFSKCQTKAINAMDGLMIHLCVLDARGGNPVVMNDHSNEWQLRIA
ncbi:hypothetical protein DCM91_05085 [Chitinophaga costaii]|nr:hypothetical protein DCM91_05085 [Chitinophaga costaii]